MSDFIIAYRTGLVIVPTIDEAISRAKLLLNDPGPWRAKMPLSVWELIERRTFPPNPIRPQGPPMPRFG